MNVTHVRQENPFNTGIFWQHWKYSSQWKKLRWGKANLNIWWQQMDEWLGHSTVWIHIIYEWKCASKERNKGKLLKHELRSKNIKISWLCVTLKFFLILGKQSCSFKWHFFRRKVLLWPGNCNSTYFSSKHCLVCNALSLADGNI